MVVSHGSEITSNAILTWTDQSRLAWHYIAPGQPMQNASIESFNADGSSRQLPALPRRTQDWLRLGGKATLGRKVSDEFTVPLCRTDHRHLHRCGNEREPFNSEHGDEARQTCRTVAAGLIAAMTARTSTSRQQPSRTCLAHNVRMRSITVRC
jgi:transposase InsO family protein